MKRLLLVLAFFLCLTPAFAQLQAPGAIPKPLGVGATGSTAAVTATLAGAAGLTTYICGFNVSALGGTAVVSPITVSGLLGGSQVYQLSASAAGTFLVQNYLPCLPASAVNTAITVTTTADATATAVDVNAWGFQL